MICFLVFVVDCFVGRQGCLVRLEERGRLGAGRFGPGLLGIGRWKQGVGEDSGVMADRGEELCGGSRVVGRPGVRSFVGEAEVVVDQGGWGALRAAVPMSGSVCTPPCHISHLYGDG